MQALANRDGQASPLAIRNWDKALCWCLSALYCEEDAGLQLRAENALGFWSDSFIHWPGSLCSNHHCGPERDQLTKDLARIAKLAPNPRYASETLSVIVFWPLTHWTIVHQGHSHGAPAKGKTSARRTAQSFSVLYDAVLKKNERNTASIEILADSNFVNLQRWAAVEWGGWLGTLVGQRRHAFSNRKKLDEFSVFRNDEEQRGPERIRNGGVCLVSLAYLHLGARLFCQHLGAHRGFK